MAEMLAQGKQPEVLFLLCAGSFDRAKKITKAFVRILNRKCTFCLRYRRKLYEILQKSWK
jgi:hypothetical protein